MLITGARKGIGRYLVEYYLKKDFFVIGCSRSESEITDSNYLHYCLDVSNEKKIKDMFRDIRNKLGKLDVLINNAGIASMNHALLTPLDSVQAMMTTNFTGTFLFCREAGKLMKKNNFGRIVNFTTVATKMRLEGEAIYVATKAAVQSLTEVLSRELAPDGITVNAMGPTPIETDLIRSVPKDKIEKITDRLAIKRLGNFSDVSNVVNFYISKQSDYITGQTVFLGGI